jgi:N-acetylmuramoyl-L-alanine amidase
VVLALVVAAAIIGIALVSGVHKRPTAKSSARAASVVATEPATQTVTAGMVEVPDLTGRTVDEATVVLQAAGFSAKVVSDIASATAKPGVVLDQQPDPGDVVKAGAEVVLYIAAPKSAGSTAAKPADTFVVVIDPGHQARGESRKEPIGPGSTTLKASVAGGATGVETHVPEYEIALQISMNLKKQLEAHGVKVIMTRTTNDVNLSNSERAEIANKAHADLFLRIHCDGSTDRATSGISTLYPGPNQWTGPIVAPSKRAAIAIHAAVVAATGAVDRGVKPRTDMTGFNWSEVPSVIVETGFLSNPVEDRLLSSPHYQDKIAGGITTGVMKFLGGAR